MCKYDEVKDNEVTQEADGLYVMTNGVKRKIKDMYIGTQTGNVLVYSEEQKIDILDKEKCACIDCKYIGS